jgi:O-acetyl-ADP-ribose deacetylase (regulator of RNase III)
MLELTSGNLLESEADALVNTVNCVGVMGKGIALQFKQAFPENTRAYERACRRNEMHPGKMLVVPTGSTINPKFIINFPTKQHWKGKSRVAFIIAGLSDLVREIQRLDIKSIAIPPLGCGNGGLEWADVFPLIQKAMTDLPIRAFVYAPAGAPSPSSMRVGTVRRGLTRARAILVKLFERYQQPGYRLSRLEIQKLAYFLQEFGEPLSLNFVKHTYGPYSENLNFVLQKLEGHFISGYGDRTQTSEISLLPESTKEVDAFLAEQKPDAKERLDSVSRLIQGFETPHGLELLATVHWVVKNDLPLLVDDDSVVARVHAWNARKARVFLRNHVVAALEHLRASGVFQSAR